MVENDFEQSLRATKTLIRKWWQQ